LYGKWQQDISANTQIFMDAQYRRVKYDLLGFKDNPTLFIYNNYNFFNPKLGFSYHENDWLFYASYSRGHKEPNRDDFEAGVNQQPKPEGLNDWEAGFERKNARDLLSANVYYMKYRDQLVLTGKINDVGSYTRTNIPSSYRLGIELQGGAVIKNWLKASANLTLSRNKIVDFTEYIDDYDNGVQKSNHYATTDISFSPEIVGAATLTLMPVKNLSVDLLSKYVSQQYLDNTANNSRRLDAWFTEDLRAVYSFGKNWLKNLDLVLQVNNVFNKKYEPNGYSFSYYYDTQLTTENYYFPMAGTNFFAGVNIRL